MKVRHVLCYTAIAGQWARYAAIPVRKAEKTLRVEFETTHKPGKRRRAKSPAPWQ